jgi:hypothetical protein
MQIITLSIFYIFVKVVASVHPYLKPYLIGNLCIQFTIHYLLQVWRWLWASIWKSLMRSIIPTMARVLIVWNSIIRYPDHHFRGATAHDSSLSRTMCKVERRLDIWAIFAIWSKTLLLQIKRLLGFSIYLEIHPGHYDTVKTPLQRKWTSGKK